MATISIDFNADKNEVYLLGDISSLKANRFAWRYMRDYLHPVEDGERLRTFRIQLRKILLRGHYIHCSSYQRIIWHFHRMRVISRFQERERRVLCMGHIHTFIISHVMM